MTSENIESYATLSPKTWPRTSDGIVDWTTVFEHPTRGLIVAIQNTDSTTTLQKSVLETVEALFSRKSDKEEVGIFISELETIFTTYDFEDTKSAIGDLFRQIKTERVRKANEYVRAKNKGKPKERRQKGGKGSNLSSFKLNKKERGVLLGSFTITLSVVAVGLMAFIGINMIVDGLPSWMPSVNVVTYEAPKEVAPRETRAKVTAPAKEVEESKIEAEKAEPEYAYRVNAPAIYMTVHPEGKRSYRALYQPILYLNETDDRSKLCKNWPIVVDALNLALSRVHPDHSMATESHLGKANRIAAKAINQTVGNDLVTWVKYNHAASPADLKVSRGGHCWIEKYEVS